MPDNKLFADELKYLFGDGTIMKSPVIVGNTCYGHLDNHSRVFAAFIYTDVLNQYDALRFVVQDREGHPAGELTMPFSSVWSAIRVDERNMPDGAVPYIWIDQGKAEWYVYPPTEEERNALKEACRHDLDYFFGPLADVPRQKPEKKKGKRNTHCR